MRKVLIVWEEVPEEISFVRLEVSVEEAEKLKRFHMQFVNNCETPEGLATEINDYFYDNNGPFRFEKVKTILANEYFDLIIITGFIL